ncbi:MAG: DUF1840 domain-containing protein [Gammaproteobacteria bacterium]|nr:DUF1840 domain-containing protein [Gammaproteobacteria bacterium]
MLITFKSKASGDVMMFGDIAKQLLDIIGKKLDKQGTITIEQLPAAIAKLRQAATASKTQQPQTKSADEAKNDDVGEQRPNISLAVRAVPLIVLLERSLRAKVPVVWGA